MGLERHKSFTAKPAKVAKEQKILNAKEIYEKRNQKPEDATEPRQGCRLDLLVEDAVVVELKSVQQLLPIHTAQLLSYLRAGDYRIGFLLNFNTTHMRDGIKRVVNQL